MVAAGAGGGVLVDAGGGGGVVLAGGGFVVVGVVVGALGNAAENVKLVVHAGCGVVFAGAGAAGALSGSGTSWFTMSAAEQPCATGIAGAPSSAVTACVCGEYGEDPKGAVDACTSNGPTVQGGPGWPSGCQVIENWPLSRLDPFVGSIMATTSDDGTSVTVNESDGSNDTSTGVN